MTTEQAPSELTDKQIDEIRISLFGRYLSMRDTEQAFARAVIAADRALVASQAQPATDDWESMAVERAVLAMAMPKAHPAEPRQDSVHAVESSSPPAAALGNGTQEQERTEAINYPRDFFASLIAENSPYAFYIFQWVAYQTDARRWRLKMQHDVRTFDGREAFNIWPNGSSCGPFKDHEVEFIRISRAQFGEKWQDRRPLRDFSDTALGHVVGDKS